MDNNDSGQEDFVAHMISAFHQPHNGGDMLQAQDLEELMIMEAIRRSLNDVKRKLGQEYTRNRQK